MPYDDPDATDPMTLHGVVVQTEDQGAMREMAECFVEEYLRSGFDSDGVLRMFKTQGYAGPFLAYEVLGEEAIRKIIDEQVSLRSRHRSQAPEGFDANGRITLPVLDTGSPPPVDPPWPALGGLDTRASTSPAGGRRHSRPLRWP